MKDMIGAIFSGIAICIKRMLTYNRTIKTINRKPYDKSTKEEISLLEEMYRNPIFAQLLDDVFWSDVILEKKQHKRDNSTLTDAERSIANFYLIWKEDESKSIDNSAVE